MPIVSLSFDDHDDDRELTVFSGQDLLTAHYDQVDLDWEEVAERSLIDERRGLIITQVAVLDDVIDEFIMYLEYPIDVELYRREHLDRITIGPRLQLLEQLLAEHAMLSERAGALLTELHEIAAIRNRLAHGTIHRRPLRIVPIRELATETTELEWVLTDRRDRRNERISMLGLRTTLHRTQGCFMDLLAFAEMFVDVAPSPKNYSVGWYLRAPSP